jgi:hypothetical protein
MPRTVSSPSPACSRTDGRSTTSNSSGSGDEAACRAEGKPSPGRATLWLPAAEGTTRGWQNWMDSRLQRNVVRNVRDADLSCGGALCPSTCGVDACSWVACAAGRPGARGGIDGCRACGELLPSCVEATDAKMATCSAVRVSATASRTIRSRDGFSSASKPRAFDSHTPLSAAIAPSSALAASHGKRRIYRRAALLAASAAGERGNAPSRHCQKLSHRVCAGGAIRAGVDGEAKPSECGDTRPRDKREDEDDEEGEGV